LQILGIYSFTSQRTILETLKELHDAQLSIPIVLSLNMVYLSIPDVYSPDDICIFPTFCSVDRYAAIAQVLAQSVCKDQGFFIAKAENIRGLSFYLTDSSDIPSIRALAKDMTASFPQIRWLNLWFEYQSEIVSFLIDRQ
jgi:hypothetical protein